MRRKLDLLNLAVIVLTVFFGCYLRMAEFGFYEDDWTYFPIRFADPTHLFSSFREIVTTSAGRPLQYLAFELLARLAGYFHSIQLLYIVTFTLASSAACAFYGLLRQRAAPTLSLMAALVFALSPVTTLHQHINSEISFIPAYLLLFAALFLHLRGRVLPAFAVAALILTCYETVFFAFLAAPLLRPQLFQRRTLRLLLLHWVSCCTVLVAYFWLRRVLGEGRMEILESSGTSLLVPAFLSIPLNAAAVLRQFALAFTGWSTEITLQALLYGIFFGLAAWMVIWHNLKLEPPIGFRLQARPTAAALLLGVVFTLFGCSVAFFITRQFGYLPIGGRDTRQYSGAVPGASLLIGAFGYLVVLAGRRCHAFAGAGLAAAMLAGLFIHQLAIQGYYVWAWQAQKHFLAQVEALTPDLDADTVVIFETNVNWVDAPIFHYSHGFASAFLSLYQWPPGSARHWPRIQMVGDSEWWYRLHLTPEGLLRWDTAALKASFIYPDNDMVPGHIIYLRGTPYGLARIDQPIKVDGRQIIRLQSPESHFAGSRADLAPSPFNGFVLSPGDLWFPGTHILLASRKAVLKGEGGIHHAMVPITLAQPPGYPYTIQVSVLASPGQVRFPGFIGPLTLWQQGDYLSLSAGPLHWDQPEGTGRWLVVTLSSTVARSWLSLDGIPVAEGGPVPFGEARGELWTEKMGGGWQGDFGHAVVANRLMDHGELHLGTEPGAAMLFSWAPL